jgi:serine/threonine protein kinase
MSSNETFKKHRTSGGVRITSDFNKDTAIKYFIKNSSYTIFSRSGISGITVLGTLNIGAKSPYKIIRTNNIHTTVSTLLFKFFICGKKLDFHENSDIQITTTNDIIREAHYQQDIFYKSLIEKTTLLEPICPGVVYSHPTALSAAVKQVFISKMKTTELNDFFQHDIAFIAMEFMQDYKTLAFLSKSPQFEIYKYMAIYELYKLHKIGYTHNDFHFENVLIHESYNYFECTGSGRAIIIDFGLSSTVPSNTTPKQLLELEFGKIPLYTFEKIAEFDKSHAVIQSHYIRVIENKAKCNINDLIKLFVLYRGGMNSKNIERIPRQHNWTFISVEELNNLMAERFIENLKETNINAYTKFNKGIEEVLEIQKTDPTYLERLLKAQCNGLLVSDK